MNFVHYEEALQKIIKASYFHWHVFRFHLVQFAKYYISVNDDTLNLRGLSKCTLL